MFWVSGLVTVFLFYTLHVQADGSPLNLLTNRFMKHTPISWRGEYCLLVAFQTLHEILPLYMTRAL